MKLIFSALMAFTFLTSSAFAEEFNTGEIKSYIITLTEELTEDEASTCMSSICDLAAGTEPEDCQWISKRALIAAANLSDSAAAEIETFECVIEIRPERNDFRGNPRTGVSN